MAAPYETNSDYAVVYKERDKSGSSKDQNGYLYNQGYYDAEDKTSVALSSQITIPPKNIDSNIKVSVFITREGKLIIRSDFFNKEGSGPTDINILEQNIKLRVKTLKVGFNS